MNQIALDNLLSQALTEMSMSNWSDSQKILASRLERVQQFGNQRLNLFLLSISAASGGYHEVANKLWADAQQAPLDSDTVRYFDLQLPSNDPRQSVLIDLERAWWDFNGWNQTHTPSLAMETAQAVDWEQVVQATLDGDDAGLEETYGRDLSNNTPDSNLLWNFVALAYLQAGNVRTYDEMVQSAPPIPGEIPAALVEAMTKRNLHSGLAVLQKRQWLTNTALFAAEAAVEPDFAQVEPLSEEEWNAQMRDAFAEIQLGRPLQAARAFQEINFRTPPSQRLLLSRNALAMAFFIQGDYTQCESVFEEFRNMMAQFPLDPNSELARLYHSWLVSVEAAPEDGQPFFSPFSGNRSTWNQESDYQLDFWQEFEAVVGLLGQGDHATALTKLQRIELNLDPTLDTFQKYLTALMFLASFVMAGDHSEVQEIAPQVAGLEAQAVFSADKLDDVADSLRWAGFESLYSRLTGGAEARLVPLNPWEDLAVTSS